MSASVHISQHINRDPVEVYRYASQLLNLPNWAAGVSSEMEVRFAKKNDFGVLDHWVTINGQTFYNPMRVMADGEGSEVVFTLRGTPEIDEGDRAAIAADLASLKRVLEA